MKKATWLQAMGIGLLALGTLAACGESDPVEAAGTAGGTTGVGAGAGGAGTGAGAGTATGGGGAAGPEPMPCGSFTAGDDFTVCAATYLAGAMDDDVGGVAIASDGSVIYAGAIEDNDFGLSSTALLGGGRGVVARLSSDGRELVGLTRIGEAVEDVARASDGLAVVGDFGLAMLSTDASELTWTADLGGSGREVAVGSDGTVVARQNKTLHVFSASGEAMGSFTVGATNVEALAVHGGEQTIYVTGFKQDDGPPCTQLQIPYLRAYDYGGTLKWTNYDWNKTEVGGVSECADSRGVSVAIGEDGLLYYAGESHGGNTVHRRLPKDLSQMAPNVKNDKYNDPYNLNGAAPITYVARFDPATGDHMTGTFLCTRLTSNDKANAARPHAVAATASGDVIVAGGTACCIEDGANKTVNGAPAMGDYLGGGFLLVLSSSFEERLSWTTLRGANGGGETGVSVAVGAGNVAAAFQIDVDTDTTESPMLTFDAVQPTPGGGARDGYLAVFPSPGAD